MVGHIFELQPMKTETTAAARHEFTLSLISAYRSYKDERAKRGNATLNIRNNSSCCLV